MPKKHFLNQRQLESLTSPMRLAIAQRLEIDKEATARELSQRIGRPVTAVYHHIKQLQGVGLLRIVAKRQGPRRPEAVYGLIADFLSSAEAVKTQKGRRTYSQSAARVADAGARAFSAAMKRAIPRFEGEHRNAMVRYYPLRADKKKLACLNRLLNDVEEAASDSSEDGEEILVTVLMSPLLLKQ